MRILFLTLLAGAVMHADDKRPRKELGREVAVERHLEEGEEFSLPLDEVLRHGATLFSANWTEQEGGGRPLMKGVGRPLSDPSQPLTGKRAFNRLSAPDANSCAGCHNMPYGIAGGGGDFVTNVFVLAQRFDFITFDPADSTVTSGARDERQIPVSADAIANLRATTGMFGAGYIEMLARQMTADLQAIRDRLKAGESAQLLTKGVSFGRIARAQDGFWVTKDVEGLPRQSLVTPDPTSPPSLVIRPWHQAGNVVSLREFSNNAYHHHHGIQAVERFGRGVDADGDGVVNELTRADITAVTLFQAAMAVPGRVIPRDKDVEQAVLRGETLFESIGCGYCHRSLPLEKQGWTYSEPNPFNPPMNLRPGETKFVSFDLNSRFLPQPRLTAPEGSAAMLVPLYSDLKLHDITSGPDDPNREPLDMNQTIWSANFHKGNGRFLTKRLWGAANEPPFFHHGRFTTLRQAILAHSGEALQQRTSFEKLSVDDRNAVIEFLKTLQVLPPNTMSLVVDENHRAREWPPVQ